MRSIQLASILLLAGTFTFACSSDDAVTPGGTGGGNSTFGSGSSTGSGSTGNMGGGNGVGASNGSGATGAGASTGSGSTGNTGSGHPGCDTTKVATGTPTMIDDFNHNTYVGENPVFSEDSDGRTGSWEHEYNDGSGRLTTPPLIALDDASGMGGASSTNPAHLNISCSGAGDETWCATPWNKDNAWGQWAAVSTPFAEWSATATNCYDASQFTGIKFKAKSASGEDKILLQLVTPEADAATGAVFKSKALPLSTDWQEFEVPFDSVKMADWVEKIGGNSVNVTGLTSMAFAVRTVKAVKKPDGESLLPYDISIDDVEFY